jgi:hypothetical protein
MTQEISASIVKTTLSNQGYSIYKNRITEKELDNIRLELTIKPKIEAYDPFYLVVILLSTLHQLVLSNLKVLIKRVI